MEENAHRSPYPTGYNAPRGDQPRRHDGGCTSCDDGRAACDATSYRRSNDGGTSCDHRFACSVAGTHRYGRNLTNGFGIFHPNDDDRRTYPGYPV